VAKEARAPNQDRNHNLSWIAFGMEIGIEIGIIIKIAFPIEAAMKIRLPVVCGSSSEQCTGLPLGVGRGWSAD